MKKNTVKMKWILATFLIALCMVSASASGKKVVKKEAPVLYADRESAHADMQTLSEEVALHAGLDAQIVRETLMQARYLPSVARAVIPAKATTVKNWGAYRNRTVEATRIRQGAAFWKANRTTLERAEREMGVPAYIIVGILGVETNYGRNTGSFRVLDALATLSLDFPNAHPRAAQRREFFRGELKALFALSQRVGTDPTEWRGSYAGAVGVPQFMPSSWMRYAIDFDGDGRIDLRHSTEDVIGSVANYFKAFGWKTGMPTHYNVTLQDESADLTELLKPDILPTLTRAAMQEKGVLLEHEGIPPAEPLALVMLQNGVGNPPLYIAGTENFYTVTRYNWSSFYALSVIELGLAVDEVLHPAD